MERGLEYPECLERRVEIYGAPGDCRQCGKIIAVRATKEFGCLEPRQRHPGRHRNLVCDAHILPIWRHSSACRLCSVRVQRSRRVIYFSMEVLLFQIAWLFRSIATATPVRWDSGKCRPKHAAHLPGPASSQGDRAHRPNRRGEESCLKRDLIFIV